MDTTLSFSPRGKTVAIIGPDGAGKSTLIDTLERELRSRPKRVYMGINPDASTHALPTTRLFWFVKRRFGQRSAAAMGDDHDSIGRAPTPHGRLRTLLIHVKSTLFVAIRMSEQWYRQSVCWYYQWRGHLVIVDRHFYLDHVAVRFCNPPDRQTLSWRIHDFVLERLYPRPDLTLYLDAPPETLFARKQDVSLVRLHEMRQGYRTIRGRVPCWVALDATMSAQRVFEAARDTIGTALDVPV